MTRTIEVSQAAGVITTQYVMTVVPQTLTFEKGAIRSNFFYVTCEKQTLVNGTVTERTKIGWSFSKTGGNASSYLTFTSKKNLKPSKLARAGGDVQTSSIYYQGERIGSVEGNTRIILICDPKPVYLRLKEPQDHRYAVNWVKEHAQWIWDNYNLRIKSQLYYYHQRKMNSLCCVFIF